MAESREELKQDIIQNLRMNTGRSLEEWIDVLEAEGPQGTDERVQWLQEIESLDYLQAYTIVEEAEHPDANLPQTPQERLNAQFAGKPQDLRAVYERLQELVGRLEGATVEPHYTYVDLLRNGREFGIIYVAVDHLDLGLVLPDVEPTRRLEPAEAFGNIRISHRVTLRSSRDVDHDVAQWINAAYQANA